MVSTFSPTLKSITLRLLIALAAYLGWDVQQMDVCNAFLNATLPDETPVYMHCVKGYEKPGFVIRLRKALYGLKQSPRQWFLTLKAYLERCGLVQCPLDACLFCLQIRKTVQLLVGIHVDDLLIVGVTEHVQWLKSKLTEEYKMEDLGQPSGMLGMDVTFDQTMPRVIY